MGGDYEDKIETKTKGASGTTTIGSIRFHRSSGEVHFHDDDAKLKVAMPEGLFEDNFEKLRNGEVTTIGYIDTKNKTALTASLIADQGEIDIELRIDKAKFGKAFEKLNKFAEAL